MRTGLNMQAIDSGKCELDLSGTTYQCRLDEVSASGARLNCLGFLQETHQGDKGVLRLQATPDSIECRVTHIAAAKIRLRFVD